jgi:hypothetical protein
MKKSRAETGTGLARIVLFVAGFAVMPALSHAADPTSADLFGSQMMSEQERVEHHERMRNAQTDEERYRIRAEHHERMKERARERGVTLPDEPPMDGRGAGSRGGMGGGMGGGTGGMGPGPGGGGGGAGGR